ncbi:MAG: ABC transporter substrate-binding protein [Acidobacteriota bacterium]
MTVAMRDTVMTVQPNVKDELYTESVVRSVFEPLVATDPDLRLIPLLAETWENPTELVWRFHLRRGVLFHDRTEMVADDARRSIEATRADSGSDFQRHLAHVTGVSVPDRYTVEVTTDVPHNLPASMSFLRIFRDGPGGARLGTGPYKIREWKKGQTMRLTAFDPYWRGSPAYSEVSILFSGNADARADWLMSGQVQLAMELPRRRLIRVLDSPELDVIVRPGISLTYLGFDVGRAESTGVAGKNPFQDRRVRQAVAMCIDRTAIVDGPLLGFATEAWQIFPPDVFGYTPGLRMPRRDLAAARELLAAAGYPRGFRVRLDTGEARLAVAETLRLQLSDVGIQADVSAMAGDSFFDRLYKGESTLYLTGWTCEAADGQEMLDACFHTPSAPGQSWIANVGHYRNPELTTVLRALSETTEQRARLQLLGSASAIIMSDVAWVPLVIENENYGVSKRLEFNPRADGKLDLYSIRPRTP